MDQFLFFFKLGFNHVLDFKAIDHMLFLVVLALPFSLKHWMDLIVIVSIFTFGHSFSMLLVSLGVFPHSMSWIELLISLSIVLVATRNIFTDKRTIRNYTKKGFYWSVTLFFGLVHGFGFGSYFRQIAQQGETFEPLLGFAFGVEVVQLIVVGVVILFNYLVLQIVKLQEVFWVKTVSALVLIQSTRMVVRSIMEF